MISVCGPLAFLANRRFASEAVQFQTFVRMLLAADSVRTVATYAANSHQFLDHEVVRKAVEPALRYIKRSSADWAEHTPSGFFVLPVIFETVKTERVNARQRFGILEDFVTDRTVQKFPDVGLHELRRCSCGSHNAFVYANT